MFTTSEYKGNPVVKVGQTGGRSFTFGKAKIGAILANLAEVKAWYDEQNNAETFAVITCHECGAEWAWASDMPDKPYKPETPTETLCNACKDANRELVGRYPLAGVELLDLNSVKQLPAGEPKTATPEKEARKDNTWDARYPILLNASKDATPEQKGTPVDPYYIVGANMYGLTVEEYKNGYVRCEICNTKMLGDDTFNTCPKCREPEEKTRKKSGLKVAKGTMGPVAPKRKGQMFSDRETLGPKHQGNAALIEHGQPLELKMQDPRTDEEREADQRKAEEAQNYTLPGMGDSNTGEESRTPPLPHQLKLYTKANRQFAEAYWTWINSDGSEPAPSQPDNVKRYDFQRIRDICDKAERKLREAKRVDDNVFREDWLNAHPPTKAYLDGNLETLVDSGSKRLLKSNPKLSENRARELAAARLSYAIADTIVNLEENAKSLEWLSKHEYMGDIYDQFVDAMEETTWRQVLIDLTGTRTILDDERTKAWEEWEKNLSFPN